MLGEMGEGIFRIFGPLPPLVTVPFMQPISSIQFYYCHILTNPLPTPQSGCRISMAPKAICNMRQ